MRPHQTQYATRNDKQKYEQNDGGKDRIRLHRCLYASVTMILSHPGY